MTDWNGTHEEFCLSENLSRFKHYQTRLQCVYEDTISLLNENPSIGLQSHLSDCLSTPHFQSCLFNKFSIHILGDSYSAKCQCLNWLLGESVLPDNAEWLASEYQITIKHGTKPQLAVTLPDSYVVPVDFNFDCVLDVQTYLHNLSDKCHVQSSDHCDNIFEEVDISESEIEILMDKALLNAGLKVVLHSKLTSNPSEISGPLLKESFENLFDNDLPIFVYALTSQFSKQNTAALTALKAVAGDVPVLFWVDNGSSDSTYIQRQSLDSVDSKDSCDMKETCPDSFALLCSVSTAAIPSAKLVKAVSPKCVGISQALVDVTNTVQNDCVHLTSTCSCSLGNHMEHIKHRLHNIGYHVNCAKCMSDVASKDELENQAPVNNSLFNAIDMTSCEIPPTLLSFLHKTTQQYLVFASTVINRFHCAILDNTITKVYALSRDVLITPKRIAYAQTQEQQLFDKLLTIATNNQMEIMKIISSVKEECTERITQLTGDYENQMNEQSIDEKTSTIATATKNIQNFVLQHVKTASVERLNNNIDVLRDSFSGTLSRCLQHLESFDDEEMDTRTAAETSLHLKMILNAAYNVDISIQSSSSLLTTVFDKIKQLLQNLKWKDATVMDTAWKRKVAEDVLANLCESRLAKHMCAQFRNQLSVAHESFVSALHQLELRIQSRLEREEALKHHASKVLSPKIAQLALQSRSLIDELQYGIPKTGKEMGRGMYGVVYTCSSWALPITKRKKCAVKSVVPQDEKHWNDLALEFYYSICLPSHPRIVELYGSVIDESYGGHGSDQQAVLLIMERMQRDLHTALKRGLSEKDRMDVGLDVIEGIRYLHSQGLVHRDIKLKNILLDLNNRAKISDLGFCKPSAMMSGSIVGTPIHMPPELFSGHYDNSVDVYAFGILFWHLCAGSVRLPKNYRNCVSKDHLWTAVRKGTRPERLPSFHGEWWSLMTECWQQDPMRRPLPGILHAKLSNIIKGAVAADIK